MNYYISESIEKRYSKVKFSGRIFYFFNVMYRSILSVFNNFYYLILGMKYLVEMLQILCFIEATIATYPRKKPHQNKTKQQKHYLQPWFT